MLRVAIVCCISMLGAGCASLPATVAVTRSCPMRAFAPCSNQIAPDACPRCPY